MTSPFRQRSVLLHFMRGASHLLSLSCQQYAYSDPMCHSKNADCNRITADEKWGMRSAFICIQGQPSDILNIYIYNVCPELCACLGYCMMRLFTDQFTDILRDYFDCTGAMIQIRKTLLVNNLPCLLAIFWRFFLYLCIVVVLHLRTAYNSGEHGAIFNCMDWF